MKKAFSRIKKFTPKALSSFTAVMLTASLFATIFLTGCSNKPNDDTVMVSANTTVTVGTTVTTTEKSTETTESATAEETTLLTEMKTTEKESFENKTTKEENTEKQDKTTTKVNKNPKGVPPITDFSSKNLTAYSDTFTKIKSAVIYIDGKKSNLANNDPKLIRLLNAIAYSETNRKSFWSQGCIDEGDFSKPNACKNKIIVKFSGVNSTSVSEDLNLYDEILIEGENVWLIQNDPKHDTVYGDTSIMLTQPYMCIVTENNEDNIDLLKYGEFM